MNDKSCPVCGELAVVSCKCIRSDSTCKNKHNWHFCVKHGIKVLGLSDHKLNISACTCKQKNLLRLYVDDRTQEGQDIINYLLDHDITFSTLPTSGIVPKLVVDLRPYEGVETIREFVKHNILDTLKEIDCIVKRDKSE